MFMPLQGSGQAARTQAPTQAQIQAQIQAQQQQLQAQIQQSVQQAVQAAEKAAQSAGRAGMSADARTELQEEIRSAIDAARIAAADARIQGGPPTIVFRPPGGLTTGTQAGPPFDGGIPPQVPEILGILGVTLVCCVVGLPLARAIARWIDRRGTTQPVSQEVVARLNNIEQAVESVAVEVERISEGQRFTTRMLTERTHEPAPDFAPIREQVPVEIVGNAPANARRS